LSSDNSNTEDDILELNKDQPKQKLEEPTQQTSQEEPLDLDNVLANQSDKAKKFDIKQYPGMDLERLTAYFGSVNDANSQVQIALSQLDSFIIPYNKSEDIRFADWTKMELRYHSVTNGALNKRQTMMARVEDLTRLVQTVGLKLQTMQQEIRERQIRQMKGDTTNDLALSRTQKVTLDNIRVEELQRNVKTLEEIPNDINTELQDVKTKANWLGMQMYFHIKDEMAFDNVRADHLDNILKACDLKQMGLPKTSKNSSSSLTQARQGVS
jgi:polyhydroxyalkanoate synthesis regulator phasin